VRARIIVTTNECPTVLRLRGILGRGGKAIDFNIRALAKGEAIPDTYEVFAIRYASLPNRKASENFIGGDPHESASDLDYFVWLARSKARTFVIDTGFDAKVGARRGRKMLNSPERGLKSLGVDAKKVKDVIITHLHYDHVGNFGVFPAATFHLQDEEMAYATGRHMAQGFFNYAYEADEVAAMVREVYKGRVRFHDGDAELAPGLSLHRIGGHTKGLQAVRVHTRIGWIVLASDAAHLYANVNETRPFPIVFDAGAMVEGYRRLRELADAPELVVPGHDPLVMRRYPAPSAELRGVAVRLDRLPKP
jgi:glyoxylase-like metal-dependent hydrolase (beta-lactamase superfamily II)